MLQKKQNKIFLSALIVFFVSLRFALAATPLTPDDKRQEEEKIKELEALSAPKPTQKQIFLQFGGWESASWRNYKNLDNDNALEDTLKFSLENDLRLWVWLSSVSGYSAYLRMKQSYTTRRTGSGYSGIGNDYAGPSLDMGYITKDINLSGISFNSSLGRQYFYLGRGIAFSGVHDGGALKLRPKNFSIKAIAAHSNSANDNLDLSVPNYDKKENRYYYGLEAAYVGFFPRTFYAFGLIQHDAADKHPDNASNQSYLYNSQYFGLGMDNRPKNGIEYWLEFLKEWGTTFNDTAVVPGDKADIDGWGMDFGLRHTFNVSTSPALEFEYAYGSGDKDRTSVTDTKNGGNRFGKDTNFSYYGYFATGYALDSRLSNLSLYKLETTLSPFENIRVAKDIDIGFKYFIYRKAKSDGGVYDLQATVSDPDVGNEIDAYLYWKPSERFYCSTQYGIFYPGKAFPDSSNDPTQYFLVRTTITF